MLYSCAYAGFGFGKGYWHGASPPITTTREAARWLRAYRDQRKGAAC